MRYTKTYHPCVPYSDEVLGMSKLLQRKASDEVKHLIPEFIYFSPILAGHGPRIKFYGGTKETSTTDKSPTYTITQDGAGELVLQPWMNRKNCPNAFDRTVLDKIKKFINLVYPGLLLVWFQHLDESDLLDYLQGRDCWNSMLSNIICDDSTKHEILQCENWSELDEVCKMHKLYS